MTDKRNVSVGPILDYSHELSLYRVNWILCTDRTPEAPGRYLVTESIDRDGVLAYLVNVMRWDGKAWLSGGYVSICAWAYAPEAWRP